MVRNVTQQQVAKPERSNERQRPEHWIGDPIDRYQYERKAMHPQEMAGDGDHAGRHDQCEIARKQRGCRFKDRVLRDACPDAAASLLRPVSFHVHIAPAGRFVKSAEQIRYGGPKAWSATWPSSPRTRRRATLSVNIHPPATIIPAKSRVWGLASFAMLRVTSTSMPLLVCLDWSERRLSLSCWTTTGSAGGRSRPRLPCVRQHLSSRKIRIRSVAHPSRCNRDWTAGRPADHRSSHGWRHLCSLSRPLVSSAYEQGARPVQRPTLHTTG